MKSDEELIQSYLNGNIESFKELYLRYRIILFNFIYSLIKDQTDAEDVFQETFIKVIDNIQNYKEGNFKAFLFTIARNISIDNLRKRSKNPEKNLSTLIINENEEEQNTNEYLFAKQDVFDIIKKTEIEELNRAIEKLPIHYKEIIYLKHFANLSFEEVSKITKTPIGTLLSRFKRAIDKLKEELIK